MSEKTEKTAWKKKQQKTEEAAEKRELISEIRDCESMLQKNESLFNLEIDEDLIEAYIYEREALLLRHRALVRKARESRVCAAAGN